MNLKTFGHGSILISLVSTTFFCPMSIRATERPLTDHQKILMRPRVERLANRYYPTLTATEKDEIVERSCLTSSPLPRRVWVPLARFITLSLSGIAVLFFAAAVRTRLQVRIDINGPIRAVLNSIFRHQMTACLLSVIGALSSWYVADSFHFVSEVGGFVENGRICLPYENIENMTVEEQVSTFDHELTHLFGEAGFNKIGRDGWLAYAYQAVFSLERGGTSALRLSFWAKDEEARDSVMRAFYEGVMDEAGNVNSEDAENELAKDVMRSDGPIDPNVLTDNPNQDSFRGNRAYAIGLAGIAWFIAKGDVDTALQHLDDRGHGMTPAQPARHLQQASKDTRNLNADMQPLVIEAVTFLHPKRVR